VKTNRTFDGESVLVLGPAEMTEAGESLWPGSKVVAMSIADFATKEVAETYDRILAVHVLNRLALKDAPGYLQKIAGALKPGGTLYIAVPSLEWGARMVLSENPSPVTLIQIYGTQNSAGAFSLSGWTMRGLRRALTQAGFRVLTARQEPYAVFVGKEKVEADQHYVEASLGYASQRSRV
jgi:2-polyprenyl-3-methyl-5-hydroxy-6-metoxy-1,4-benzoquinol methylase